MTKIFANHPRSILISASVAFLTLLPSCQPPPSRVHQRATVLPGSHPGGSTVYSDRLYYPARYFYDWGYVPLRPSWSASGF
jgi:hypothetical protein